MFAGDPATPITAVVAEDEFLVAREVVRIAERAGIRVVGLAADGLEALQLIQRECPQVAILDVQIPRMDGIEVARRLQEDSAVPVVILTAYETNEILAAAKEVGVGAYLVKPATPSGLRRAVEIAMARHEDLREARRLNAKLQLVLEEVKTLRGLLPICSYCKRIRNDDGAWEQMESYVSRHSGVEFSHGLCSECLRIHYPDFVQGGSEDKSG